jgi:hypothetical protein
MNGQSIPRDGQRPRLRNLRVMTTPLKTRAKARERLAQIKSAPQNALIIHYSCESLIDREDGRTPRITSIAVRRLEDGQTESFSLHREAEKQGVPYPEITRHFDQLEESMLAAFFQFVGKYRTHTWIHWNMRDSTYGFPAINHRFEVLGGKPVEISESNKFDLSRAILSVYGAKYIGHPRLAKILERNDISMLDFLAGADEAAAFEKNQFIALHKSTLRKVGCYEHLIDLVSTDRLKSDSRFWHLYGTGLKGGVLFLKDHWTWALFAMTATVLGLAWRFLGN